MISTTPAFNLKVILKETGLTADTLRAWERRYGLPVPERTAGGHRLYSQRDIETVKWLMKRQTEGLSISRAVDLWKEQTASGTDPLADSVSTGASSLTVLSTDTTLPTMRTQWIQACMEYNETRAEQTLNQAFAMFPVEAVCIEVLQKGMAALGMLWYQNQASIQQEHFASALAMRRLDTLLSATPAPTQNKTVLVGCSQEEWHSFTALLLSLFLRRRGLNIIYLGANVPTEQFAETVKDARADMVILIAQQLISAATLKQTALSLSAKKIPVAFGGRIFTIHEEIIKNIPGYYLGPDLEGAVEETERLLKNNPKIPDANTTPQMYLTAYQAYQSKRAQIELTLKENFALLSASPENIKVGIHFLGDNIAAALQLGNMSYVSIEVDWLQNLLQAHNTPAEQLIQFLEVYAHAVDKNINGQGKPITEWLASEIKKVK